MVTGDSVACEWYTIVINNVYFGIRLPIGYYTRTSTVVRYEISNFNIKLSFFLNKPPRFYAIGKVILLYFIYKRVILCDARFF